MKITEDEILALEARLERNTLLPLRIVYWMTWVVMFAVLPYLWLTGAITNWTNFGIIAMVVMAAHCIADWVIRIMKKGMPEAKKQLRMELTKLQTENKPRAKSRFMERLEKMAKEKGYVIRTVDEYEPDGTEKVAWKATVISEDKPVHLGQAEPGNQVSTKPSRKIVMSIEISHIDWWNVDWDNNLQRQHEILKLQKEVALKVAELGIDLQSIQVGAKYTES